MPVPCPAPGCGRTFPREHAMKSHLRQAKSCSWYWAAQKSAEAAPAPSHINMADGANDEMDTFNNGMADIDFDRDSDEEEDFGDEDPGEVFRELQEEQNIFHFVDVELPVQELPGIGVAGPGPSTEQNRRAAMLGAHRRILNDEDDERVSVEHPTAARVIRMDQHLHQRWAEIFRTDTEVAGDADVEMDDGDTEMTDGDADVPESTLYAPFASELDWKVAQWAVKDGIGHKSFDRLLKIPGVKERLGLSYSNIRGLHKTVDSLPGRAGQFRIKELSFPDRPQEKFILRHRDVIQAIRSLWGDPSLAKHIVYKPSKLFTDRRKKSRVYNEMWTGQWWWAIQDKLPKGHTLAPLIVSTDKTQLTQFSGSRQAYPVYLTLGNIPNSIRRKPSQQACILLGYLPVDKVRKGTLSKKELSARHQRLFHEAMRVILEPLVDAGKNGIEMTSGDGAVRMVHPVLACYVADFPEQCMVTCSKYGTCPKCQVTADQLGDDKAGPPRTQTWTTSVMAEARSSTDTSSQYFKACMDKEVSGYVTKPFWDGLPFTDIHLSITPDVLHQLYQGVLKHLISWCQTLMTEKEMDRRIRRLPRALGLRHFKNGISALSQISGTERKNMGKILLGCLVGTDMSNGGLTACRAILDFIYLAQYSTHDNVTLGYMEDALALWHANKSYFIRVGLREDFNIPKFHSLHHYVSMIRFMGTTNNYNTEMFERLHIDFAKKGWRATNKRDEYPQMTKWILRQENVSSFQRFLDWAADQRRPPALPSESSPSSSRPVSPTLDMHSPSLNLPQSITISKHPTAPNKSLILIETQHRVPSFSTHLKEYLASLMVTRHRGAVDKFTLPFDRLDVFYSFKFNLEGVDDGIEERDVVKATALGQGRFDTVVVLTGDDAESTGLAGTRIARVHVIFRLPSEIKMGGLGVAAVPSTWPQVPMAYVEWFKPATLSATARRTHNMPSIVRAYLSDNRTPAWSIIPLANIRQSDDPIWDTDEDVLDTNLQSTIS